jgi:hypothetical protein
VNAPRLVGFLRKLALLGAVGAAAWTWADTLKRSWASNEWTGLWGSSTELRGTTVKIDPHDIETNAEREKREKQMNTGLVDDLRGVKRGVLGDKRMLRGKDINGEAVVLPPGHADYTQREACMQQKMEFPERFKDLDCMSDKYDDTEPWMKAPSRPSGVEGP